jgi:glycosyltransferase involved in cell wall biosynthesis
LPLDFTDNLPIQISVCMSSYQHKRYIQQAIEGVMMQRTSFPIQLVIGDDLSDDGTREICEEMQRKYGRKINLLASERKYGQNENLARIIKSCTGKYIALCEGDDFWTDPNILQKQFEFLESHPDYVLCFHQVNSINADGEPVENKERIGQILYYNPEELLNTFAPTLSLLFKNCLHIFPKEFFKVKSTDAFLVALLSNYGLGANLGFVGGSYRKHEGGLYNRLDTLNRFKQSIHTRKMMKGCSAFSKHQQLEIERELIRREKLYIKIFLKKGEWINCFRIIMFYLRKT